MPKHANEAASKKAPVEVDPGAASRRRRARRAARGKRRPMVGTGALLAQTGLSRQMLYSYVTMGLIHEAERTPTGRKLFDERDALARIKIIRNLNASGYTLRDIGEIFLRDR